MRLEEIRYSLWQIISDCKKTLFGYRITVMLINKDSVKVGDTVYIDTDRESVHSYTEDTPAVVYKLAWSNWVGHYYTKVKEIAAIQRSFAALSVRESFRLLRAQKKRKPLLNMLLSRRQAERDLNIPRKFFRGLRYLNLK